MSSTNEATSADQVRALGRAWWLVALLGVITLAVGIVLTFKPGKSVHTVAVIIGIWLLVVGVIRLIQAIGATGERLAYTLVGLLSIVVALILLHHTTTTVAVLGFVVGIFWTLAGVATLFAGLSGVDGRVAWGQVLLGVIGTVIGVLCLVYPSLSLSIICVVVGVGMIVYGVVEIVVGIQLRRLVSA